MKKIDTTYWAKYRVGDLFEPIRGSVKKMQILPEGNVPVIAAARGNQGVAGYYDVEPLYCNKITVSCNGAGCGSTFYHDYPFNINGDAIVLIEKEEMPEYAKQFVCCMLDGLFTRKYSYEEKCSPEKAREEIIMLPAIPNGEPDWQYMEQYMQSIETRVSGSISALNAILGGGVNR
ncbi:MAG: restriction endonuclease subunit S [Paludibacteraceae bacterium]